MLVAARGGVLAQEGEEDGMKEMMGRELRWRICYGEL